MPCRCSEPTVSISSHVVPGWCQRDHAIDPRTVTADRPRGATVGQSISALMAEAVGRWPAGWRGAWIPIHRWTVTPRGRVVWLGLRWVGVPAPARWALAARWAWAGLIRPRLAAGVPGRIYGCGCLVGAKKNYLRAVRFFRRF